MGEVAAVAAAAVADGAWMGTAFMATDENEIAPDIEEIVVRGRGADTVWASVTDILNTRLRGALPWPAGIACRVQARTSSSASGTAGRTSCAHVLKKFCPRGRTLPSDRP